MGNNKKFRLPRKIKKKLKKNVFLYPSDSEGSSLMGFPASNQKDYDEYKKRNLTTPFTLTKKEAKRKSIEFKVKYEKSVSVTDVKLKEMVDDYFHKDYRKSSYDILIRAKNHPFAIKDYCTFINAYKLDSSDVICALCLDTAEVNLKKKY